MSKSVRRFAAHRIISPQGVIAPGVVTIQGSEVVACNPLEGEEPATEWIGGDITIRDHRAYHDGQMLNTDFIIIV